MKKVLLITGSVILLIILFFFFQFQRFAAPSKGEKIGDYKNPKTAVLVIDIQEAMTDKNGKAIVNLEMTDAMIKNVNKIITKSVQLNFIVVYIQHMFKNDPLIKFFTKGVLSEGAPDTAIDDRINIINKNIFIKHIMDSFSNPELDKFLIKNQVNHLIITGMDAEACVDKTTKAALNRNYKITVINDATATRTEERRNRKLKEFKNLGADIITTKEFLLK